MSKKHSHGKNDAAALDAALRDMQALIESVPGSLILGDAEGNILCANSYTAARLKADRQSIIGKNVLSFFPEPYASSRRKKLDEAVTQKKSLIWEDERDGMLFRHTLVPVLDHDGEVHRVAAFTEEITQRKNADLALRAREEQFRFLAENTADVVWQLDSQLRLIYVNEADQKLRGFSRDEVLGKPISGFFNAAGNAIVAEALALRKEKEARGETGVTLRFEAPQIKKDGSIVWVELNSTPIYDAAGKTIGFNGMTRDIHERKNYQSALIEANRQLQTKLAEITELQKKLSEQVVRDPLTGLHNRRYFDETLPRELARAKREGYPLALIMIDLDHFKRVNDTYGHPAGDEVLKTLSNILHQGARESDIICRYGGEEFLVALPRMALHQAQQRAEIWRSEFAESSVRHGELIITNTLSAGVSAFPEHGADFDALFLNADQALYRAKENGRNRVVCCETAK